MTKDQALIPQLISHKENQLNQNILSVFLGVILISILAQISIRLPWTPVPITGQTFGVALLALIWGRKRSLATMLVYLFGGAIGLPIFALGKSGFSFGPTAGYLIGMVFSSYWIGYLADCGLTKKFFHMWLAVLSGSLIVYFFGVIGLSFFIPKKELLISGVLPFIPGDLIKTFSASLIAHKIQNKMQGKV